MVQLSKDTNYLHRMICLQCISSLAPLLGPSLTKERFLPTVLYMRDDKVANVRFKVRLVAGWRWSMG